MERNSAPWSRDKTYIFLWTSRQFQQEQTEWDAVNRLLQQHGFKPVRFTDPTENKSLAETTTPSNERMKMNQCLLTNHNADLVLLERASSSELRVMLKTMLTDSERRQALIQELIQSNSKLKRRAEELEDVLAGVKVKVQGLEDSIISKAAQQRGQLQQLQQDKRDAEMHCEAVQQQLSEQVSQVCELQKKLHLAVKEEEKRTSRQNQAFQQFLSRSARIHSPSDQLILDVISVYESQLQDKLKRCRRCSVCKNDSSDSQNTNMSELTSSSYKTLLKSYQEQLKKTKVQREALKSEIQRLRQDLDSRPSVKELKWCKQQVRRLERLVQDTNIRSVQMETAEDPPSSSTETQRHITESQRYITEICSALKVQDVGHVVAAVKARCREADSALRLEKVLNDITAILTNPRAPLALLRGPDDAGSKLEQIVPTLEMWSQQLRALPDLHCSVSRLVKRLLPWQLQDGACHQSECVKVEDVILMVDTLLDETAPDDKVLRTPTKPTLQAMVSHFQKLFDVPSLRGVYLRMNKVYTRLAEMNNVMRNLRDILDMDDGAPPSDVVNTVARIMTQGGAYQNPHELLGTSDIDSIIVKLREHEEFFPAFHSLVLELLNTLGAESLEDILPQVKTLKSMTE
ncbi:centrosomal protein of 70 kDa isoform X2 [Neoarius graeffei]|uniref:centrosomal protein of 70 kDa isoform X2 n=1 Tax=Neoarius graeffei TaxID=443677 RepID=UPI00298CC015|nr:centrosomal protein of 70 kDa isoform X2 [Neoarius graeffei]